MQINSASDNSESAPEGTLQGAKIPLGIEGGDAPINSVSDNQGSAPLGSAVTNIPVSDASEPNVKSAGENTFGS